MTGTPFERESRRARKRRKERERELQRAAADTAAAPQLAIRDVFSPTDESDAADTHTAEFTHAAVETAESGDAPPIDDRPTATPHPARRRDDIVPAPESASEQLAALQHALQEKDELLKALTAQLEEAANRLDRLHRAGIDRGPRVSTADAGACNGAAEVNELLARLCGDWEELQPAQQFESLRNRLDDIFDAVTLARLNEHVGRGDRTPDEPPTPLRPTDSASKLPGWEDMKAQLLREGADQHRSHASIDRAPAGSPNDSAAEVLSELPLEPPAPVDLESADRDLLAAAVEERDVFISHLIRRLRSGASGRYAPINWAEISGAPDELRERLQEHEARLQELLRMEECDLSLERARLARERARLEQMRRDVERDARGGDEPGADDADRTERRWLRVFGFGRKGPGEQE